MNPNPFPTQLLKVCVSVTFLIVLALKLTTLQIPFTGYFGGYQAFTGMVAKVFSWNNFSNLLVPQTLYLIEGKPAVVFLYYPIPSLITSVFYHFFGGNMDVWGKGLSIVVSTASVFIFYSIVMRYLKDKVIALLAVFFFMIFPINWVMGQTFMNESLALFFLLLGHLLMLPKEGKNSNLLLILGTLFCSLSFLLRIHFIVCAPVFLIALANHYPKAWKLKAFGVAIGMGLIPMLWFLYVYLQSSVFDSLHTSLFTQLGEERRFTYTLSYLKDFPNLFWGIILSPIGFVLTLFGMLQFSQWKERNVFYFWFIFALSIGILLPQKAIDHPFYLLPLLPPAAVFSAVAFKSFFSGKDWNRFVLIIALCIPLLVSFRYVAGPLYQPSPEGVDIIEVSERIDEISSENETVIVSHPIPIAVLYYADRTGWAFFLKGEDDALVEKFKKYMSQNLASYYIVTDLKTFNKKQKFKKYIESQYSLFEENSKYLIYKISS